MNPQGKQDGDRSLVYRMVRERLDFYTKEVDRLMAQEATLLPLAGHELHERIIQLAADIQAVEVLGGDATALRVTQKGIIRQRDENEPKLEAVHKALHVARECMKNLDHAHDGLHWLCFVEPRYAELNGFVREQSES